MRTISAHSRRVIQEKKLPAVLSAPYNNAYFTHNNVEVKNMAKQGMKRPDITHSKKHNEQPIVPEIQGKAKHGNKSAGAIIAGSCAPSQKVYHSEPYQREKPISKAYKEIDNDLARDNLENDMPEADLQDI